MKRIDKRLIVVLGMHRSGTSAVTRGLQVMGVDLGHSFIPPQEDNVTGFWEDTDLNAFNIELLQSIQSDWHFLAPIESFEMQNLHKSGYIQRAVDLLQSKTSGTGIFGFKDPRVAKILPFWKDAFDAAGMDVSYIIVIRHPLSVCKSLEKRHGFDFETSSLLWLEHVVNSVAGTEGENRVLVDYDLLMQSPEETLQRIAKVLQTEIDPAAMEKFKNEFLSTELQHTVYQVNDMEEHPSISPLVQEVYSDLLEVAAGRIPLTDASLQGKINRWQNEISQLRPALVLIDRLNLTIKKNYARSEADKVVLNAKLAEKDLELSRIYQSRSWKFAKFLQSVLLLFKSIFSSSSTKLD